MRSRDVLVDAESAADYKDQKVILPRGCFPISADDEDSWEFADSLYDKLITPEELVAANCHYAIEGKCAGYVIFPFYEDEELVYWQGRAVWPELANDPGKRKLNPRDEELPSGLGKGCWLYGVDSATSGGEIFLCEGTLDRMTLHSHVQKERGPQAYACSLQGTSLTYPTTDRHWLNSQFGKITALEPSSVCVLFDPDAHAKAQKLALELRKCGLPAYAGKCPDHRDPNELADHPHLLSSAIQPPNPSGLIELDPTKLSLRL